MSIHPLAGKPAPLEALVNIPRLISAYYTLHPTAKRGPGSGIWHQRAPRNLAERQL